MDFENFSCVPLPSPFSRTDFLLQLRWKCWMLARTGCSTTRARGSAPERLQRARGA